MEGLGVVVGCGDCGVGMQVPVSDGVDKAVVAFGPATQATPAPRVMKGGPAGRMYE